MKIETKYDIDEIIKFRKVHKAHGNGKDKVEEHVGFIEKVLISDRGISYLMKSSYQNWVAEEDVLAVLVEKQ